MTHLDDDNETNAEISFIKDTLLHFFESSYENYHKEGALWGDERLGNILETFMPITDARLLEKCLPPNDRRSGRLRDRNMFLYLQLVEKENALPILDFGWDLDKPHCDFRFRFFLLHFEKGENTPRAVGFRLEPPEGSATTPRQPGTHDYWHAQMISELDEGDKLLEKIIGRLPEWVPTKQPAFPLPAKKPGDLLAILLLSLYGARQLADLSRELDVFPELADRLKEMDVNLTPESSDG